MFNLPTLNDLVERARQSFRANLPGSDAWVWPNNVYVSAKVIAATASEIIGYASYIARQNFAHTAPDIESLRLHGAEFGIPQKPAAPAEGYANLVATAALTVEAGAVLSRSDDVRYVVVDGGGLVSAGTLKVAVIAITNGQAGNAAAGTPLAVVSGVTGGATASVAAPGVRLGEDVETFDSYQERILFRKRNVPMGGSAADYVRWAREVSGVTRVFVERLWAGPGTVRVFILMDDAYGDGVPDGADITRVAEYISALQPAGAMVAVVAPAPRPIAINIKGLSPNTTAVREAVLSELRDAFLRLSRVAGVDHNISGMPFLAYPTSFSRSWLWQAVANASGEQRHEIIAPALDVALSAGEIATLGTVTFTD